jgi:hypothetical protein
MSQITLFANGMILYSKDPKNATRKLSELINSFSNVSQNKISMQKTVVFYMLVMNIEKEIRKTIPFIIA